MGAHWARAVGHPFNSLVQLKNELGVPRNPFINAGAIAVTDRLVSHCEGKAEMLARLSSVCNEAIHYNPEVAASEAATGYLCRDSAHPYLPERQVVTERQARRINSLMLTCGTYDAAGEFAFLIGLPCKSGVGGGIVAVVPDQLTLCVWSPALDATGNSLLGRKALELFVARTGLSVF